MPNSNAFELFGSAHLSVVALIVAVAVILPLLVRYFAPGAVRQVAIVLCVLILAQELIKVVLRINENGITAQLLPLQLCTISIFLSAWVMITRSPRVFEVLYFWGLGGATQALMTPDVYGGFSLFTTQLFFFGHGLIIVCVGYALIVFRMRPVLRSIPRVIGITLGMALVALIANLIFDTNYMYLLAKPEAASILDLFGPWPWYLPGLFAIGVISFVILYVPFFIADLITKAPLSVKDHTPAES